MAGQGDHPPRWREFRQWRRRRLGTPLAPAGPAARTARWSGLPVLRWAGHLLWVLGAGRRGSILAGWVGRAWLRFLARESGPAITNPLDPFLQAFAARRRATIVVRWNLRIAHTFGQVPAVGLPLARVWHSRKETRTGFPGARFLVGGRLKPARTLGFCTREWLSGRASPCQGEGRGFDPRLPLPRTGRRPRAGSCLAPSACRAQLSAAARLSAEPVPQSPLTATAPLLGRSPGGGDPGGHRAEPVVSPRADSPMATRRTGPGDAIDPSLDGVVLSPVGVGRVGPASAWPAVAASPGTVYRVLVTSRNWAPAGSATAARRPWGVSSASRTTEPPSACTRATAASVSSTSQ